MSEQTANLCTTDAAESLRAVVAERDREIERLKEGQSILILALDEQKRLANEYRDLWSRAALKAQPSGVVHHNLIEALKFYANGDHLLLADPDAWDTCSGEPINFLHDDAGTASVEDGSIAKAAMDSLNSSPVSAGDSLIRFDFTNGDGRPDSKMMTHDEMRQRYSDLLISNALALGGGPVCAGGVDERVPELSSFVAFADALGLDLRQSDDQWNSALALYEKLIAAYPQPSAALSAPSHGGGVAHTDCRSEDGITVGLIDSIITSCRVLSSRDLTCEAAVEALRDLRSDSDVSLIKPSHGEQVREVVPVGWKLVPVEPTPEMIDGFWGEVTHGSPELEAAKEAYSDMLAAAPSAGSQKEQG